DELVVEVFNTLCFIPCDRMWVSKDFTCLNMAVLAKRILALMFLLMGSAFAFSQSAIDSLEAQLKKKLPDHVRVNTLLKLSNQYEYVDITKSRELTEQA